MSIFQCRKNREAGSSLIEMMIAMVVLTVGLIGSMAMVGVAVNGDYRSKSDSTSTALAQMVLQKISTVPVCKAACGAVASVQVTDCTGTARTINVAGTAAGAGAPLTADGKVDFTQAAVANYSMNYRECGVTNGMQATYDVRWNIKTLPSGSAEVVVVGARLKNAANSVNKGSNAPAVSLRTIVGNDGN
ncbi:MAG TPA: prepilin-type N-terminal cleavage/methylation domain-containing protein [Candidatus Acidoferrales bacterium]|nr:prepilin-type N-terminal cleavage/methylation domain-containing protein [Candidatus Acidoferrales bacterium]